MMNDVPVVITAVADEERLQFWPKYFGSVARWTSLEPQVFGWMDHLCEDYNGGIWNFFTLSNGGAFIAPDCDSAWSLYNDMNGNSAEMSSEAAGITVCLLNWSHHACRTESEAMTDHYYRLREYALSHAESRAIMRIID